MSNEVVRNAIDTFGLNIRSIDPATESFSSIVRVLTLSCGEKVVLKVPTSANKLIRECKALKALGNVNFVPKLLSQVEEQDGLSALIMEWLPGQPLPLEAYTRAHCEQVGEALAELHSAPYPNDNKMDVSGWWDELRAQIKTHLDYCRASQADQQVQHLGLDLQNLSTPSKLEALDVESVVPELVDHALPTVPARVHCTAAPGGSGTDLAHGTKRPPNRDVPDEWPSVGSLAPKAYSSVPSILVTGSPTRISPGVRTDA